MDDQAVSGHLEAGDSQAHRDIQVLRHIVVSVPHSGTRTLKQHLKLDHYEHFFTNRHDLLGKIDFHAHIPVRHPLDVAKSWATRRKVGNVLDDLIDSYTMMFKFMDYRPHHVHRIEDIDIVIGTNEHRPQLLTDRVRLFQATVTERVIVPHMRFFGQHYQDMI